MSAQHHTPDQDSVPQHDQAQFYHTKAEHAEVKKAKYCLKNHGPAYPPKNRFQPPLADQANLGDKDAHRYDGDEFCPKLLPVDRQEFRGCKTRDVDRQAKAWNKQVYLGLIPGEEDVDASE